MPEAIKLTEAGYPFVTQVGPIQKILTRAPNYIFQLAKACRAPQAIAILSTSMMETTKA